MQAGGLVRRLEDAQRIDVLARMTRPGSKLAPPRRSVRALEPVSTKANRAAGAVGERPNGVQGRWDALRLRRRRRESWAAAHRLRDEADPWRSRGTTPRRQIDTVGRAEAAADRRLADLPGAHRQRGRPDRGREEARRSALAVGFWLAAQPATTKTIPAGVFKQGGLRLLDEVAETHREIVITKRGAPVARLVPVKQEREREEEILARLRGRARMLVSEGEFLRPLTAEAGWDLEGKS